MTRLTKKDRQFTISLLRRYIRGIEASEKPGQFLCYAVVAELSRSKFSRPLKVDHAYHHAVRAILDQDTGSIYHLLRGLYGRTHVEALSWASDIRIMLAQLLILHFEGKLELR